MKHRVRSWAGRFLLVGLGVLLALGALEGILRLAGSLYQSRAAGGSDFSVDGNAGTYRVLCLGESTTAGLASGERSYPRQLEEILNERAAGHARFEVVNAGRPGTTTDVIVATLPDLLEEYEPDIVVTMMGVNDGHLNDPAFQVGDSLRVWKLLKMLYYSFRSPTPDSEAEELLVRAEAAIEHSPSVAIELANQASRLVPDDPRASVIVAEARVTQDQIELAAKKYLEAFEVDAPAIVAYSFTVARPFIGVLDWVLSRLARDANALAARAVMAIRRRDLAAAEYFSRRATEIDPRNAVGWVVYGRVLQLTGSPQEAQRKFDRAAASHLGLVELLSTNEVVGSRELFLTVARERQQRPGEAVESERSDERWFRRETKELNYGMKGLHLKESWEEIARGETDKAAQGLHDLAERAMDVNEGVRLRAYGQLAILAWQRGDAEEAEQYHRKVDEYLEGTMSTMTADNYRALSTLLRERNIPLVAVQYPMRRLATLQRVLSSAPDVVFVDNERPFKDALLDRPYTEIFYDLFAGDFGHMTVEGNRILASNVASAVLLLVPEGRAG